jgi:hypothetical protein
MPSCILTLGQETMGCIDYQNMFFLRCKACYLVSTSGQRCERVGWAGRSLPPPRRPASQQDPGRETPLPPLLTRNNPGFAGRGPLPPQRGCRAGGLCLGLKRWNRNWGCWGARTTARARRRRRYRSLDDAIGRAVSKNGARPSSKQSALAHWLGPEKDSPWNILWYHFLFLSSVIFLPPY